MERNHNKRSSFDEQKELIQTKDYLNEQELKGIQSKNEQSLELTQTHGSNTNHSNKQELKTTDYKNKEDLEKKVESNETNTPKGTFQI